MKRLYLLILILTNFYLSKSAFTQDNIKFDGVDDRYTPVVAPNTPTLPWRMVNNVKVYHLVAEEFTHDFAPGLKAKVWGYNKSFPGPVIEAVEGDKVRIYVTNKLPEPTSVHWHGILLPSGMDGVSGLSQEAVPPGKTFKYEFTLRQHGTHMYHSHFDEMTQIGIGTTGLFIIHPKERPNPKIDRDFALMLGEWKIDPGTSRPNPNEMVEFNILTFNGKAFPGTDPLVAKLRDRVKLRVANLSQTHHHPIHLHGYQFKITETDGGQVPPSAQQPETTILAPVGTTRTAEFIANEPGDWALHCHMTHHVMNQMGHGLPNMIGVKKGDLDKRIQKLLPDYMTMGETGMGNHAEHMKHMEIPKNSIPMLGSDGPFGYIDMGGMFTILKVRDGITNYKDPGWYKNPEGTVAQAASADELHTDLGVTKTKEAKLSNKTDHHSHH
jgi:manganese oxidase